MEIYSEQDGCVIVQHWEPGMAMPEHTIWIDLLVPTREQEAAVENYLGMLIPTREEMGEIEVSNRLYQENDTQFLTATMVTKVKAGTPETHAVTFIVRNYVMVTVRHVDSTSFKRFSEQLLKQPASHHDGATLLLELLHAIINRIADMLERVDRDIDRITKEIFKHPSHHDASKATDYQMILERIGRCGDLASKTHESLVTLGRVISFTSHSKKTISSEDHAVLLESIRKDIHGLIDHGTYLTGKVNFLLDATLGMISIEQNSVFRVLSIASLIFMPPTLIAGIYGMNFKRMPELEWYWGYPMTIALIVIAAILPIAYLRRRKVI